MTPTTKRRRTAHRRSAAATPPDSVGTVFRRCGFTATAPATSILLGPQPQGTGVTAAQTTTAAQAVLDCAAAGGAWLRALVNMCDGPERRALFNTNSTLRDMVLWSSPCLGVSVRSDDESDLAPLARVRTHRDPTLSTTLLVTPPACAGRVLLKAAELLMWRVNGVRMLTGDTNKDGAGQPHIGGTGMKDQPLLPLRLGGPCADWCHMRFMHACAPRLQALALDCAHLWDCPTYNVSHVLRMLGGDALPQLTHLELNLGVPVLTDAHVEQLRMLRVLTGVRELTLTGCADNRWEDKVLKSSLSQHNMFLVEDAAPSAASVIDITPPGIASMVIRHVYMSEGFMCTLGCVSPTLTTLHLERVGYAAGLRASKELPKLINLERLTFLSNCKGVHQAHLRPMHRLRSLHTDALWLSPDDPKDGHELPPLMHMCCTVSHHQWGRVLRSVGATCRTLHTVVRTVRDAEALSTAVCSDARALEVLTVGVCRTASREIEDALQGVVGAAVTVVVQMF